MTLTFKRHYKIMLLLLAVVIITVLALGNQRVIAYTTHPATSAEVTTPAEGYDISNSIDLFDDSVAHTIQVIIDPDDYAQMISTYQQTGEKDYFQADIIIDGVRINKVGLRLKGNASLRTAIGGEGGGAGNLNPGAMPGNDGNFPQRLDGGDMQPPTMPTPAAGQDLPDMNNLQHPNQMMPGGRASDPDGEANVPFLVRFDQYVDGQTYQGYQHLSIRNYGTSYDAAMLQEPVTNDMVQLTGLPATDTAYTSFQLNENPAQLYVISEIIDEKYLARWFENANGVLYKAELGSTLSYQGDDPSAYASSFSQETRENEADFAPLIAFIRFLDQSDDATFEAELPNYLDVDAFATYLAVNNLLVNTDSIIGMNNNYYLYWDDVAQRFTLLMWDANESLGKLGGSTTYDVSFENTGSGMGGRGDMPGRGGMGGGMGGGSNILFTRFINNPTFKALYLEKVKTLYQQIYTSQAAVQDVERYSALIKAANEELGIVDVSTYEAAVQSTLTFLNGRAQYLSTLEILQ